MSSKPKVFTYHAAALSEKPPRPLYDYWKSGWEKNGWEPVLLTLEDAKKHPRFSDFDNHVRSLPTVNPVEYEVACYHRWLALEVVGGGLMVDYDVMNYGFMPSELAGNNQDVLFFDPGRVPCAVHATSQGAANIVDWIRRNNWDGTTQVGGRPHTSDMIILQRHNGHIRPLVAEAGTTYWMEAPLVHYANGAVYNLTAGRYNKPEAIKRYRPV
jgi:hypothetical protein